MKFKMRMQGFVFGIVVAAIVVSLTVPAIAAGDGFLLNTVNIDRLRWSELHIG